jgi:hypothetical protein
MCGPCRVKGESVDLSVYTPLIARQRVGKHVSAAARNCWRRRFLSGSCRIKGKQAISPSQNFLLSLPSLCPSWLLGTPSPVSCGHGFESKAAGSSDSLLTYLFICSMFNDAVSNYADVNNYNVEGSDLELYESTYTRKDLRIDGTPVEIRTVDLQKHYRFNQLILHLRSVSRMYRVSPSCLLYACKFGCLFAGGQLLFSFFVKL